MGRAMRGRFKREGIYVYLWLIHVEVWQKTAKFCKAISLQWKINFKKWETNKQTKTAEEEEKEGLPLNLKFPEPQEGVEEPKKYFS